MQKCPRLSQAPSQQEEKLIPSRGTVPQVKPSERSDSRKQRTFGQKISKHTNKYTTVNESGQEKARIE